jgi:hypothetical protein
MRRGVRWPATILILGGLVSCGQSQATTATNSPASPVGVYTLSASGCIYEGKDTAAAGRGSVTLSNKGATEAHFDFWRLDKGRNYAEFLAHIQEGQRRFQAREPELGHPTFASLSTSTSVAAGASQPLALPGEAGTYGMACIPWNSGPTGIFAAGPLAVSG